MTQADILDIDPLDPPEVALSKIRQRAHRNRQDGGHEDIVTKKTKSRRRKKKNLEAVIAEETQEESSVSRPEFTGIPDVSKEVLDILEKKGYSNSYWYLGSGYNRDTFRIHYETGTGMKYAMILKLPRKQPPASEMTVGQKIYLSKEINPDLNEIEFFNMTCDLLHPGIVRPMDSFEFSGGQAIIEEYFEAQSLTDFVAGRKQPPTEEEFEHRGLQLLGTLAYLVEEEKILHRDIKPSNLLIGKNNVVKLTDFQNAKRLNDVVSQYFPTKTATEFTRIDILNGMLNDTSEDEELKATPSTECYSTFATLYYDLVGKAPFDYALVEDQKGKPIKIGNEILTVSLKNGDKKTKKITEKEHESNLKKALEFVPWKYKKWFRRGLTLDYDESFGYHPFSEARDELMKLQGPARKIILKDVGKKTWKTLKWLGPTAILLYGLGYGLTSGWFSESRFSDKPRPDQMFNEYVDYSETSFTSMQQEDKVYNRVIFDKVLRKAKKNLLKIKRDKGNFKKNLIDLKRERGDRYKLLIDLVKRTAPIQNHDTRLCLSLVRACLVVGPEKIKQAYGDERTPNYAVPINILYWNRGLSEPTLEDLFKNESHYDAMINLKASIGGSRNVEEVFARYFLNDEVKFKAQQEVGNHSYFGVTKNGVRVPGFREALEPIRRDLIDTAVSLYNITDNDGRLHFRDKFTRAIPARD